MRGEGATTMAIVDALCLVGAVASVTIRKRIRIGAILMTCSSHTPRSVLRWARDHPERKFKHKDNAMKYSAPQIVSRLNAKYAIQSIKDISPRSDGQVQNFVTPLAYHADE